MPLLWLALLTVALVGCKKSTPEEQFIPEVLVTTMTWGEQNTATEAHAQIERALALGINFIDTAEMYPVPPKRETITDCP